ncbi:MAG: type II toxin-antitoxin system RelE/ParE family toxin [Bacteroidetes bacterium]|nr:type II toxin-antitoxin system RelE/ParE family toxin [Bacteroidota bacterium]
MKVLQTNEFAKAVRKLPKQQKADVDNAVRDIIADPAIGRMKAGDLAGIRVFTFKINRQNALLAYEQDASGVTLYLLKLGSHGNFYRDLKRGNPSSTPGSEVGDDEH